MTSTRGRTSTRRAIADGGDIDVSAPAELIGHPARSAMLVALLDRHALPMSVLATEAGVAVSTASEHLAKLVAGGLLTVRTQGRNRYYALTSREVAEALEALARLAPLRPIASLRADSRARAMRLARSCYDHVAGHLGVAVFGSLVDRGAVEGGDGLHHPETARRDRLSAPGWDIDYRITPSGREFFADLGVPLDDNARTRRRLIGYCVDWTEQRHHLAGRVGAGLLNRLQELDWLRRDTARARRSLLITDTGRTGFAEHFAIDTDTLAQPRS